MEMRLQAEFSAAQTKRGLETASPCLNPRAFGEHLVI